LYHIHEHNPFLFSLLQKDYDFLYQNGCAAIFGPGTRITDAARELVGVIEKSQKA
jgi:methylmalonyl-CoA mutase cobalamin-binding domain/chain